MKGEIKNISNCDLTKINVIIRDGKLQMRGEGGGRWRWTFCTILKEKIHFKAQSFIKIYDFFRENGFFLVDNPKIYSPYS